MDKVSKLIINCNVHISRDLFVFLLLFGLSVEIGLMFYSQKKCIFANKFEAMMPSGPYRRQFPWRSSIETGLFWGLFPKKWHVSVSRSSPDFHTCYTHYGPYSFNIAEVESRAGKPALPRRSNVADCNGKEKDWESGFHYYGARYYWSELLTSWLSVDPMIDSLAYITPYSYCINNPIKLKDNDGNIPIIPIIIGAIEIGTTIYDAIGAGKTLLDNNATPTAKWAAVGGLALDIALPGGGYGAAYRMTSKTIFKIAGKEYRTASEFYKASKKLSIGERMTAYKEMADEVASKEKWVFDKTLSKKTEVAEYILTNLQECITRLIQKKDISRYLIKRTSSRKH